MSKIIELSSQNITNRRNIKWVVHEINTENLNGCNFKEPYVSNNIESAKNMHLYATFLDSEENNADKKNYSDHGEEETSDGDGYIFPNTDIVGSATNAYVIDMEVDGKLGKYLLAEGYIQEDKYPAFVKELEEELNNGNPPKTSIEIVKTPDNDGIMYEAGKWTPTNRVPTKYNYNGSCFVLNPSDKSAILLELNSQRKEKKMEVKIELNELSYDDLFMLIQKAFNVAMKATWYDDYWIIRLYPTSTRVIFKKYEENGLAKFYQTTFSVTNNDVTIGEIIEVEEDWKPVESETAIEVNSSYIKDVLNINKNINKKEDNNNMDEKKLEELNSKIEELTKKVGELESKNQELNSTIVEANKTIEEKTKEMEKTSEEINSLRQFKTDKENEAKKTEINSYFETEIKKNGFTEVELNSLKAEYVEKVDLEGLKKAEADLCVKKFKEINSIKTEINSKKDDDLFIAIHNNEKSEEDYSDLF